MVWESCVTEGEGEEGDGWMEVLKVLEVCARTGWGPQTVALIVCT